MITGGRNSEYVFHRGIALPGYYLLCSKPVELKVVVRMRQSAYKVKGTNFPKRNLSVTIP